MSLGLIKRGMCLWIGKDQYGSPPPFSGLVVDILGSSEPHLQSQLHLHESVRLNASYTVTLLLEGVPETWVLEVDFVWPDRITSVSGRRVITHPTRTERWFEISILK